MWWCSTWAAAATDGAAVIKDSRERPEVFARLYDRHAADIHRYAARRPGDGMADDPEKAPAGGAPEAEAVRAHRAGRARGTVRGRGRTRPADGTGSRSRKVSG